MQPVRSQSNTARGQRYSVELKPRFFRVLRILVELAFKDDGLDLDVRGLRKRSTIARLYAAQANDTVAPDDDVITRYVMIIRQAIEQVIEEIIAEANIFPPPEVPEFIVTTRGLGYSIGNINVILIDHTADTPDS